MEEGSIRSTWNIEERGFYLDGNTEAIVGGGGIGVVRLLYVLGTFNFVAENRVQVLGSHGAVAAQPRGGRRERLEDSENNARQYDDERGELGGFVCSSGKIDPLDDESIPKYKKWKKRGNRWLHILQSCHFVDVISGRHEVAIADIAGVAVDPLSRVLLALIDGINQSETRRSALIVFCAVYLQVRVQDAYIFSADRWGFNVLAKAVPSEECGAAEPNKLWREFRFGFSREVKDAKGFCVLLAEMEKESLDAVKKAQEVDPDFLKENVPEQ